MADYITTTSADDYVFASWKLASNILPYFYGLNVAEGLVRYASLAGLPTKTHDFPVAPQLAASGLSEGVDMTPTPYATSKVSITAAEVGIQTEPTDVLNLSSIVGNEQYAMEMGQAMAAKRTSDILALGGGFSNATAGGTGVDLTEAHIMAGVTTLMANGVPGPYKGVLHPQQWYDLAGGIGTTLTPAGAGGQPAREATNDLAMPLDGGLGRLYGVDWTVTSLVPTANAGADRSGMIVNPNYAIGLVEKYPVRVEPERDASLRATEINITAMYGVGELKDAAGLSVLSDA
uniref:Putative capsid protein n=1 Tax=viral metagenome TaxID=1070528 RepID=A0A6M3KS02_9ZZZZ